MVLEKMIIIVMVIIENLKKKIVKIKNRNLAKFKKLLKIIKPKLNFLTSIPKKAFYQL